MQDTAHVVQVEKLQKKFGQFVAVDRISFEVTRGEIFGFLGPNGAGKTTTINILSCRQGFNSRSMLDGLIRQSWGSTSADMALSPCLLRTLTNSGKNGCRRLKHSRSVASQAPP